VLFADLVGFTTLSEDRDPMHDAHDLVFGAGIAALEGDRPVAARLYREGRQALRDYGLRFPLALSGIDMAVLLADEQATDEAISEARQILTELGAAPFLERLEAAATAGSQRSPDRGRALREVPAG